MGSLNPKAGSFTIDLRL